MALDFIRGNIFDPSRMRPLPQNVPGPDNDLNELIHKYIAGAIGMETSAVYAFGQRWGPEKERDKLFGFKPGSGIHDIHMNQGNSEAWRDDDGVYQDGGLIIHLPDEDRWVGIFLAFQSQCFHTEDTAGHSIGESPAAGDGSVRIIAALVNPEGQDRGLETVLLLNTTPDPIDLAALADKNKKKSLLKGVIWRRPQSRPLGRGRRPLQPGRDNQFARQKGAEGGRRELYER